MKRAGVVFVTMFQPETTSHKQMTTFCRYNNFFYRQFSLFLIKIKSTTFAFKRIDKALFYKSL